MGVVFVLAASANLSVLVLSLYRKRFNTAGAVTGTLVGLVSCVVLVALSPTVIGPTGLFQPQVTLPFPLSNRSWAVSRSESWLTGTPRTVLGALVLRFRILVGDAYPVCAPFQAGGIPTTWPCGCGQRRRGGPEPSLR
ncbi:hypothetical protein [Streptomyces sp. NPDC057582]|uniref:hypothetical protein n=1 Tax=Streptomyces sp. NPDC057582 TaxID=3346174 RepID=UPI0036A559DA